VAALRLAFLGPAPTTAAHAQWVATPEAIPTFIDARAEPDRLRSALLRAGPDVVVVLEPDDRAARLLAGFQAATLAVGATMYPRAFDRMLALPGGADGAWRTRPLPIDDRLFAAVRSAQRPPRALYVGRSTEHRERMLIASKHAHDLRHYAYGLTADALVRELATADVGIALHADEAPGFPPQALLHLAAGHLLIAEPLSPPCGLEPGLDHLEIASGAQLVELLRSLRDWPEGLQELRERGRAKAEEHRASRVWPALAHELLQEVAADTLTP
jgi:hypothetical protein